ncbi:hypothetical protein [Staphylococcus caprae]|uniref:hypothetical protein n=1 Tax=Staphylococcus caprae TaxID=29380 RepID=UPI000DF9300A|nr:hypothetical protein [Staphylococcus caprae]SUL89869.1 Uncharacterised protein [Staphylococcus caprae]
MHHFKKNEIKKDIENRGMNFKEWSEKVVQDKRMQVIDKVRPYFDQWELDVLNEAYIELLKESVKPQKEKQEPKQNQEKDTSQTSDKEKGGGIRWN